MKDPPDTAHRKAVEERRVALLKWAERKYGAQAMQPGGHPDRDVLDYLINELVGLPRYADMVASRVSSSNPDPNLWARTQYIAKRITEEGRHLAFLVERLRWELIHVVGMDLGKPEDLGDDSHE